MFKIILMRKFFDVNEFNLGYFLILDMELIDKLNVNILGNLIYL